MTPIVSLHIVTWNSMQFIPDLLASIEKQTYKHFQVVIIDNASTDGVESFVREKYPHMRFIRNARNLGFSVAHNQGIRYALEHWDQNDYHDRFILVTNPDVILSPTFLEEIVHATDERRDVGAFGGKLLRAYGDGVTDEIMKETVHSDRIDSTGLRFHKNYTFTDRGAGEMDEGQYDQAEDVFGLSGALVLYRASALQDIRVKDEFFDQDFFAYKEDVDLAFRLQYHGWRAWYEPSAVAYHFRGMYGQEKMSFWARMKNRKIKSLHRNYFSTRNHWLLLVKNLDSVSFLIMFPRLLIAETLRFLYVVLLESKNSKAIIGAMALTPKMWNKRRFLMKSKRVTGRVIRKRFAV